MQAWYALRVRSRYEKKVAEVGHLKGYEGFLPLYRSRRRWSDRAKWIDMPLFPGYVFFRVDPVNRLPLLTIGGALHFVGGGRSPEPVDESEIAVIRNVLESDVSFGPCPFLESGQRVRLKGGPLAGLEGFLVETSKKLGVVVSMNRLRRSMAIDIEPKWLNHIPAEETVAALQ